MGFIQAIFRGKIGKEVGGSQAELLTRLPTEMGPSATSLPRRDSWPHTDWQRRGFPPFLSLWQSYPLRVFSPIALRTDFLRRTGSPGQSLSRVQTRTP